MKEIFTYLLLSLFGIGTAYFGYQSWKKSDWVHPGHIDEAVDENTRVYSAIIATERALKDSIRVTSEKTLERIRAEREHYRTLTTLAGRVRTVRDTVEVFREVPVPVDKDTTITFTQTFSDSLFIVTSELRFRDGKVSNHLDLEQLRDLRIDIALTERQGVVMTYVTSTDFELNKYRTLQLEPKQERDNRAWWFAGGFLVATTVFVLFR